jgi:hypothetical protein
MGIIGNRFVSDFSLDVNMYVLLNGIKVGSGAPVLSGPAGGKRL